MKNLSTKTTFVLICLLTILSCSDDESESVPKCLETNITVLIDGELQTFYAISRGISLTSNGYELVLGFYSSDEILLETQDIIIFLPYKKTGEHIIDSLYFKQYKNTTNFEGVIVNNELQSDVTINTNSCFSGAFKGKLNDGIKDITIESIQVNYLYDAPFDN
jgi:hypothetical protein